MTDTYHLIDPETAKLVKELANELDREVEDLDPEALEYALDYGPRVWRCARAYKDYLADQVNP